MEGQKRAAAGARAPHLTCDEQEAGVLLSDAQTPGGSPAARPPSRWPPLAALVALLLAGLLAAGASVAAGPPAAWRRGASLAQLRGEWFEDSRNPSLRRAAKQEEGDVAGDIAAVYLLEGGEADGAEGAAGRAEPRSVPRSVRGQPGEAQEVHGAGGPERAFQEVGSAEEGERGRQALEELVRGLPS